MPISDKSSHLNSDEHKNKTEQRRVWCEDCSKYISDTTRHLSFVKFIYKTVNGKTCKTSVME